MSRHAYAICDRCKRKVWELEHMVILVMPIPDGHVTLTDVWMERPAGDVDVCKDCVLSYRQWWLDSSDVTNKTVPA